MAVSLLRGASLVPDEGSTGPSSITKMSIQEESSLYTVLVTDDIIICTGTFTVNLPALAASDKSVTITSKTGTITVDPDGAELINGSATEAVAAGFSITIAPTSVEWVTI